MPPARLFITSTTRRSTTSSSVMRRPCPSCSSRCSRRFWACWPWRGGSRDDNRERENPPGYPDRDHRDRGPGPGLPAHLPGLRLGHERFAADLVPAAVLPDQFAPRELFRSLELHEGPVGAELGDLHRGDRLPAVAAVHFRRIRAG